LDVKQRLEAERTIRGLIRTNNMQVMCVSSSSVVPKTGREAKHNRQFQLKGVLAFMSTGGKNVARRLRKRRATGEIVKIDK